MDGQIVTSLIQQPKSQSAQTPARQQPQATVATKPPVHLSRRQIIEATGKCLNERGYDGTTIRSIAGQLGCAVGSIYRHFKDKRDLLNHVTQRQLEPVVQLIEGGATLEISMTEYHRCARRGIQEYQLMFWLAAVEHQPAKKLGDEQPVISPPPLPAIIERIIAGWTKRLGDPVATKQAWAMLHGSIILGRNAQHSLVAVRAIFDDSARVVSNKKSDHSVEINTTPNKELGAADDVCLL